MHDSTLVLGLDGLDDVTLSLMQGLASKLRTSVKYDLHEDLWVRGWSKVFVGAHASDADTFTIGPFATRRIKPPHLSVPKIMTA